MVLSFLLFIYLLFSVPPPVQNVQVTRINGTAANVTWDLISITEARGTLTNYTVTLTPQSASSRRRRQTDQQWRQYQRYCITSTKQCSCWWTGSQSAVPGISLSQNCWCGDKEMAVIHYQYLLLLLQHFYQHQVKYQVRL